MTNISLDLSNKIPNQTIEILQKVTQVTEKMDIPVLLIGATARDLVLEYGYGLPRSKATRDIDFGVAVHDWNEYQKLKIELVKTGDFNQDLQVEHRLTENHSQTIVDFVPFGEIESPPGQITFQGKSKTQMNISGFTEVYDNALTVRLSETMVMKVASPVGFVLLKLFSWNDRRENKDASDFWLVAKNYLEIADNQDRIYSNYANWLVEKDYDFKIAGAKLLGIDIAEISSAETKLQVLSFFEDRKRLEKFALEVIRMERRLEDNFENTIRILKSIEDGFRSVD
jgi:predicted nucleotidyltransferase